MLRKCQWMDLFGEIQDSKSRKWNWKKDKLAHWLQLLIPMFDAVQEIYISYWNTVLCGTQLHSFGTSIGFWPPLLDPRSTQLMGYSSLNVMEVTEVNCCYVQ